MARRSMLFDRPPASDDARAELRAAWRRDEPAALRPLVAAARLPPAEAERALARARAWATRARARLRAHGGIDALVQEYDLSSEEGVLLMCLAEALLRIPDETTQEALIREKLARGHWSEHLGRSHSVFVNASTWGLTLSGRVVALDDGAGGGPLAVLERLAARAGERVARIAIRRAMVLLAEHFVAGSTIEGALRRARSQPGLRWSFDCLGEAARGASDVERYFAAYRHAIDAVAAAWPESSPTPARPGISIKLSALHPRYEFAQRPRVLAELVPRVAALAQAARAARVPLTLDAEESERLELQLDVFEAVYADRAVGGWDGFGLAVQAYQKRAAPLLEWLAALARRGGRRIPVRLVKGAYWDTEIKRAQQLGLDGYPVFTRKHATDVSYAACAATLLAHPDAFHAQFATHNAYTAAYVLARAGGQAIEFQRLHGMGEALYAVLAEDGVAVPCRVYAPVGSHEELLPYLVRRLLENGAATSFVNRLADEREPIERLVPDPVAAVEAVAGTPHPRIPLPAAIYAPERRNSDGIDLTDPLALSALDQALVRATAGPWRAAPLVGGAPAEGVIRQIRNPADRDNIVGYALEADAETVRRAFALAAEAQAAWDRTPADERAQCLERAADAMERRRVELIARIVREGGRTVADALAEVREAIDACRYYAARARRDFGDGRVLPGPTGESNRLYLRGRGVFGCISPWNFPVAIYTGPVAAALAAGNGVIAKPAQQTPLCAALVTELLHQAGIPGGVLHFLPGGGASVGEAITADDRLAGIALTGSTETAWRIQEKLARRRTAIASFIAETGGQNVMIADSSALPEQLIPDVLVSAFNSAGQRCSALRVLFVQADIAERVIGLLAEAMDELIIGDPMTLATDIGPLIDRHAMDALAPHVARMQVEGRLLKRLPLPAGLERGSFFPPHAFELDRLDRLTREVFGPILHVIRYDAGRLDAVIDAVNATGYGLTLGVHSRIEATWERVRERARVGNLYVNRNMIGAVVGVQPFGGEGLSGTGPKAGGPHYLHRFAVERTVSINTAAIGGNAGLLSLGD